MARKCDWHDLTAAISAELSAYSQEVADGIKEIANQKAKLARKEISRASPERTGSYKQGWKIKRMYDGPGGIRLVVHNATDYQLTHLLEKGYQLRRGGRAAAIVHIAPVEQRIAQEYTEEAKELLKK